MTLDAPTTLPHPPADQVVDVILDLFHTRGDGMYAGEPVTQTQHALQCAQLAEGSGAKASLIAAALLHDIGHLLHNLDEHCAEDGIDDAHELAGALWLAGYFPRAITEPIRLHVPAKRYRCAVDATYHARLSDASKLSLRLQGGPYRPDEVEAFRANPFAEDALQLRLWDEAAKVANKPTPPVGDYGPLLRELLQVEC